MAFIVEDGTAKADANAYVSVAFVTAYLAETGDGTAWGALVSDTIREQAIVKATRYIDQRFAAEFQSRQRTRTQALEWPREDINFPDGQIWIRRTEIPNELERACAEYASRASIASLLADPASSRESSSETIKVGPITVATKFSDTSGKSAVVGNQALSEYPAADLSIAPLLKSAAPLVLERV